LGESAAQLDSAPGTAFKQQEGRARAKMRLRIFARKRGREKWADRPEDKSVF
jgi:hypothetical protein